MTAVADLALRLAAVEGIVLDIDGCLVLSDGPGGQRGQALPGAADALRALQAAGRRVLVFTNASNRVPAEVAADLRAHGMAVETADVLTPSVVAAELITRRYGDRPVLAFGGPGLVDVLAAAGVAFAPMEAPETAAAVVVGWDTAFGRERLQCAAQALWAGADLLVTSDARRLAGRGGPIVGVGGFIARGLSYVGGRDYEVVGKPSAAAMAVAAARLGVPTQRTLVAGDDLTLEVRMARTAGAVAVLVTTGLHGRGDAAGAAPGDVPDLIVDGLPDLADLLLRHAGGSAAGAADPGSVRPRDTTSWRP